MTDCLLVFYYLASAYVLLLFTKPWLTVHDLLLPWSVSSQVLSLYNLDLSSPERKI